MRQKIRVLIIQQINRAYRVPLLTKVANHPDIDLTLVHGTSAPVQAGDIGISIAEGSMPFRTISGPISGVRFKRQEALWFGLSLKTIKQEKFDVVICDYYLRLLSIWPMQSLLHKQGGGIILWGIGFHQYPTPLYDKIRIQMLKRTDALLLYSEKEKHRYQEMGVSGDKCFVATNTVDVEGIESAIAGTSAEDIASCKQQILLGKGPVLMHIGRLAQNKRLDLLVETVQRLQQKWPDIQLVLIGEGPERENIQQLARDFGVGPKVHFAGSITDHKDLAPWILACDLIVAPGQIGLQAPMALVYGKTLVISDKTELHGPEVRVFEPGQTGLNYEYENIDDLVAKVDQLLGDSTICSQFANVGKKRVVERMGTEQMLDGFMAAIQYVYAKCNA